MARITSYATLATAVQAYMHRADIGVSAANLDYLCSEVEEELNARLRVRLMLTAHNSPTISSAGVLTLPTDYLGWKRFTARDSASEWDLKLLSAEQLVEVSDAYSASASQGIPKALITMGATSQIWPYSSDYTYRGLYFAKIPELTSGGSANWVITNFPNAYLYGCLAAARGLVLDDKPAMASRFEAWAERFDHAIKRIEAHDVHDLDARSHATLGMDTSLFGGRGASRIEVDG